MHRADAQRRPARTGRSGRFAAFVAVLSVLLGSAAPALAAPPATPSPLPAAIEAYQPYVGQKVCDPVAKPGVRAFSSLVLNAYRDTTSLGIVRDCGIGGASEHKEGRAWDWGVSAYNAKHVAEVNELLTWLMATDKAGNPRAHLRRLGIMYVIWNKKIFKAYSPAAGWQPYTGASPHTDHVHFSFGWAGARKTTSFFDGTVAAVDYGPGGAPAPSAPKPAPTPAPAPVVRPVASPDNLKVLSRYGSTTLRKGSEGDAVTTVQRPLGIAVDGDYGPQTAAAVAAFQRAQGLSDSGVFGPESWSALFPMPTVPYGELEGVRQSLGQVALRGWALDAETSDPVGVHVYVNGKYHSAAKADLRRDDVARDNPGVGSSHGYDLRISLPDGKHEVCTFAINAPGTAGSNPRLGCLPVTVSHAAVGALTSVVQGPTGVVASGWALDPDVATATRVAFTLDGKALSTVGDAKLARPELAASWPEHGTAHGFAVPLAVPDGVHKVCATARNAPGTPGADRALGCLPVTVQHNPTGALDAQVLTPGKVVVSGWTLDRDSAAAIGVQVHVDGRLASQAVAGVARDLPAALSAYGRGHGFRVELQLPDGARSICVTGLNATGTPGAHTRVGCRTVTVRHSPLGWLDELSSGPAGVTVGGWALDPDTTAPVTVQVLVGGKQVRELAAIAARTDVAAVYPLFGAARGMRTTLTLPEGKHTVCLRAVNARGTAGATVGLGCRDVVARHTAVGGLDEVAQTPSGVAVTGWALDPDTAGPTRAVVHVDGVEVVEVAADQARPDVASRFPGYGPGHGLRLAGLSLRAGKHTVCLTALDVAGTGSAVRVGCRDVVVAHDGKGVLEAVTPVKGGVALRGRALDPDTAAKVRVHVQVGGVGRAQFTANRGSAGLLKSFAPYGAAYPAYGAVHGFSGTVPVGRGTHDVCVWALNAAGTPGTNGKLGCKRVTVV